MSLVSELKTIADYNPTAYVNNSEPDLDAEHLNKTELALKRVTDAANDAINALKELEKQKLSLNAIVQTESTATDKVPSSAYFKQVIDNINSNLDDRTAVADLLAIANVGPSGRRIVNCGGNTLNTPYKAGLTTLQSGTAVVCMSSANYGTILYVAAGATVAFLRSKVNGTWGDWKTLLSNSDYEAQTITNSYGLTIILYTFGNDSIKALKMQGYINKALTVGTEYTLATNAILKSRVNWYHNVLFGGKSKNSICYLNIDTSGNFKITPQAAVASGDAMSIMEYYV